MVTPRDRLGRYERSSVGGEEVRAFIPSPLPPVPPLDLSGLQKTLEEANQALGRLDGVASILPDTPLFLYMYVRKEALLSSQIEGTQSSLSDLLLYESEEVPGVPLDDVQEVSNYVRAMNHGLQRLKDGFPLSLRLLREIHGLLLAGGRGQDMNPGEFRRSQNWIGGTRPGNALYVPPPPHRVQDLMGDLETYIHRETETLPTLVKAGLVHVQFESIHPFLDGNGRLGRLLITFLLCEKKIIREPLLYISLFFKYHRSEYYRLLQNVRDHGSWEEWMEFFFLGVRETSTQAATTAKSILRLFDQDASRLRALGRAANSTLRVHQLMQSKPMTTIQAASATLGLSQPTVANALGNMETMEMVHEVTGRQRGRVFVYTAYLKLLSDGTDPIDR